MLSRIKFRIVGGEYSGKYVCNIENGKTVFFNRYFRPQDREAIDTCFSVLVSGLETQIDFIGGDFLWNGKPLAPVAMKVNPGDSLSWETHDIEILDCPQVSPQAPDKTKFLDLAGVFKKESRPKGPKDEPPPFTNELKENANKQLSLTPIPKQNKSIIAPIPSLDISPEVSQVESSMVLSGFGSVQNAPEVAEPEPFEKIVLKSEQVESALSSNDAVPNLDDLQAIPENAQNPDQAFSQGEEIKLIPMRPTFNAWFQVVTMGVVFLCFGSYVFNRFLSAKTAIEFQAQQESLSPVTSENMAQIPEPQATAPGENPVEAPQEPIRDIASDSFGTDGSVKQIESSATPLDSTATPIELKPSAPDHSSIFAAIDSNDIEGLKEMASHEEFNLEFTDSTGKTPVTHAAAMGRLSILKLFNEKKADLNVKDAEGNTALMWAVLNEKKSTIRYLIEQGVDRRYKRGDGKNAFALAKEKNKDLLKLFTRSPASSSKKPTKISKKKVKQKSK